jgi:formylglycine-generating enzyme required for sulfatase activity
LVYASANLDSVAWFNDDVNGSTSGLHTHIVGEKAPNAWGLYDMHGNVNEFCLDGYHKDINPDGLAELVDPPGLVAVNGQRSFKGGGYSTTSWYCRSGARSYDHMQIWAGNVNTHLGVRLVFQAMEK